MASSKLDKFLKSSSIETFLKDYDLTCKTTKSYSSNEWKEACIQTLSSDPVKKAFQEYRSLVDQEKKAQLKTIAYKRMEFGLMTFLQLSIEVGFFYENHSLTLLVSLSQSQVGTMLKLSGVL